MSENKTPTGSPALTGLTTREAEQRFRQYGPNALEEQKVSTLLKLLGYFWGPIPWMIEVAALLSALVQHWPDFAIVMTLLIFNAGVGFWQEFTAGNAVEALKKQLALKARALRDGKWQEIGAERLVPGDIIRIRLGDVVPADVKLVEGDYLSVDQSALTGESLPVTKRAGDEAYSGTVVKQGEVELFAAPDAQAVLLAAALASREEDRDTIDEAVLQGLADKDQLKAFQQVKFVPFDPVHKRTEATVQDASGQRFQVTKGAPQVIMEMAGLSGPEQQRAQRVVDAFAEHGYRALGVAQTQARNHITGMTGDGGERRPGPETGLRGYCRERGHRRRPRRSSPTN